MSWPMVPLKKVAPSKASPLRFSGDQSVWHLSLDQVEGGTGRIVDKKTGSASDAGTSTYAFDEGNVLYSKLRPYLNKVVCPEESGIATTELVPLRPVPGVMDRKFLAYYLRSEKFLAFATYAVAGVKMPRIIMEKFWNHEVPLPPPSEQQRIVEILDQADALRRKRAEADEKAQRILPALFIKMFGDPATNPMGWSEVELGEHLDFLTSGSRGWGKYYSEEGAKFVRVQNLKGNAIDTSDMAHVSPPDNAETKRTLLRPGDILISITGVIGLCSIVPENLGKAYVSQHVALIRLKKQGFIAPFVASFIGHERGGQRHLVKNQYGQTKPGLGLNEIRKLKIPVPPLDLQIEFEQRKRQLETALEQQVAAATKTDCVWKTAVHRAYSGDLTAKWREAHADELLREAEEQARMIEEAGARGADRTGRGRPRRTASC